ncbi:GTP-binding protein [Neobacillus cucumis]|uniref:CobW family GTP-binding protein n=1 Tax=Neobacillus cucumis TaxID=1740721 RepID=UPI00203CBF8D|nr:GTP-binding protein [Neobacillus cucumis]MCM3724235.1 GTP-binding protein [Neobacillus cucumis]
MKKTEVYILSGFLGSGKTTLLKRFLADERSCGRKVAVLMNELGQVSIDSNEVEEDVLLSELLGGCICCSIQDKLEAQLHGLLMKEKPEVMYIETTGAAHPVEVLDSILSPLFADQLLIKGIITTVDGTRWKNRNELSPQLQQLILEQVRNADFILINKIDELKENEQAQLIFEMQGLNPRAQCLLTSYSMVPMDRLRNLSMNVEKESSHIHLNLSTYVYQFHKPISDTSFEKFLKKLPDTIYRIKGYIKFHYSELPLLFQYAYGMPLYMKEYMNMRLNLVFIGEHVDWGIIEQQLVLLESETETV